MTIKTKIETELKRLSEEKAEILSVAEDLNKKFDELIVQVKDHLSEISREMPEYDKHDASHSEAVLEIIEQLLREQGVEKLTLLEAMLLRFCCYFHDTGMILPAFCLPLLEQVEADPKADPRGGLVAWLKEQERDHENVKGLFLLPETPSKYRDFLIRELVAYRDARLGLKPRPENVDSQDYVIQTRHDYLRRKHADRAKTYAMNLSRCFAEVIHGSEADLAEIIGNVCAAHGWKIEGVRKLPVKKELLMNCPELTCNVRYLAMLLRLGDLLHFGPARASRTLYLERSKMDQKSDLHWLAKQGTRGYRISPTADGGVDIAYHGSFDKPKEYYFVQDHMNWVDRELTCYEAFRRQMEKQHELRQYDLGLPEKVNREHATARGFEPDRDLKFRLEHRNIIELLMGARLYRDEFMCLRELYQNALDACRCMRAERPGLEPEIEFGLGNDDGGDYLYCRDQGTGMTMDIVKNYLLRIGNSYYKSEEFRRKNAHWGDAVAPVSEFGIGLLSCYMIADRIDVITRHHTAVEEEKPIWISMSDHDDFGYRLETDWFVEEELGKHGTLVKLYLKEEYKDKVTGYIPEEPKDLVFLRLRFAPKELQDCAVYELYKNSLYSRIQQYVHIPEEGVPVYIQGSERREAIFCMDEWYDWVKRIPTIVGYGVPMERYWSSVLGDQFYKYVSFWKLDDAERCQALERGNLSLVTYPCRVELTEQKASAFLFLRLPKILPVEDAAKALSGVVFQYWTKGVYIDGMPIESYEWNDAVRYSFRGKTRPRLTVDRGEIRKTTEAVWNLRDMLWERMIQEIAATIRRHVNRYPEVRSREFWDCLIQMFERWGLHDLGAAVLRELATDLMKEHVICGASLHDWFHGAYLELDSKVMRLPFDSVRYSLERTLLFAESIRIEKGKICIHKGEETVLDENDAERLDGYHMDQDPVVSVDTWPEEYLGYDVVESYPNFVPSHFWNKLDRYYKIGKRLCYDRSKYYSEGHLLTNLETPMWQDVLLFLQEDPKTCGIHVSKEQPEFIEEGNCRYITYVYVEPEEMNEEAEAMLTRYSYSLEFVRGIREGWSILYYNYKNGYVIAPGIVDRMEMLKLLPQEALEHDDGLEYYFTDGTKAF